MILVRGSIQPLDSKAGGQLHDDGLASHSGPDQRCHDPKCNEWFSAVANLLAPVASAPTQSVAALAELIINGEWWQIAIVGVPLQQLGCAGW